MEQQAKRRYLIDTYLDWCAAEGPPVVEDFCVDLNQVDTRHWPRLGTEAAFVHLKGRGDFISMFVIEIAPGGKSTRQRHLYEEVFYVLSGSGSAEVELADGSKTSFEWGPRGMFSFPLNMPYRLFNASGREPARLVSTNNLPMMMNLLRNEGFIFDNPAGFPEREGKEGYFAGNGESAPNHAGRTMWETNFVPDLGALELERYQTRGAGAAAMSFSLAESTMHAHISEMPVGTYKKAHRHGTDFHVCIVRGQGYSLFWYEHEREFIRYDWREGCVFAPTDMIFHQHFNTRPMPVRYLATAFGSNRYPFLQEKIQCKLGVDQSVSKGGRQIEYEDQDPRIHRTFLDELAKHGVACRMGEFIDEGMLLDKMRKVVA